MRGWRAGVAGVAIVVATLLPAATTGAGEPAPSGRVLVLSLPTLSWDELYQGHTPTLDRLFDGSAVAAMSVRDVLPLTTAGDGYAAMSAGTRAEGGLAAGQVLEPREDFYGSPAGDAFARTTGFQATDELIALGVPALQAQNDGLSYGAEIGALGSALDAAGIHRSAIANADGLGVLPAVPFHREAAIAMIDAHGVVPDGAVARDLLEVADAAPFGVQLSADAVSSAFESSWERAGVVLVEGSDLARADRYAPEVAPGQRAALREWALQSTDALVGRLLESVDPAHDSVLVVAPYHRAGAAHLTVAALRAPDVAPGLLRSATTRRAGIVALVDIAPTILDLAGVDRPGSMEGRRFEGVAGGPATGEARAARLSDLDDAARYRDGMVAPVAVTFVVLQAPLWIGAILALRTENRRRRDLVGVAALAMLAYLPATYLAGLIDFHGAPPWTYWVFVGGTAVAIASVALSIGQRDLDPLLLCLGTLFGLLVVDMLIGAPLQLNTVFGYSPTIGGRFAGMGNLAYGQFAGAAFLLGGLMVQRLPGRRTGMAAAFGILGLAILIDGMPIWGSDVGGVLAFVPAVGITAAVLLGHRLRWRAVALWGSLAVAVVGAFALVDLSRPADRRTHLGRLVEAVGDQGVGALESVVTRKVGANLTVIASSVWTAMVPIAFGFIVYLLWKAPGQVRAIRETIKESLPGLAVVGFLGFALNDSGIAVPGVMLGVMNASLVYLTVRTLPSDVVV